MKEQKTKIIAGYKIPKDWEVMKLGELKRELVMGQAPPGSSYNNEGKGIPFVKATEFWKIYPRIEVWTTNPLKEVDESFILISIAGTIGLINKGIKCAIGRSVAGIKPDLSKIDFNYLFYYLQFISPFLIGRGSSQKIIIAEDILKIKIIKPKSLPEQKAIAQILSTVDEAIQKVDEIIAKTERLKKGLMQRLLTKGIGHKEFKDTEIGRIPKEWEVVKVGEILSLQYGKGLPERERVFGQYPVVGSNGIVDYHTQALVKGPGIVVGRKGTIGAVSWIDRDFWPIDTTYYVKPKTTNISLRWLFYELTYLNPARFHLADVVPGLKKELVYSLKMPFPPLLEQEKIAEILSTIDKKLEFERKRKEKLEKIKKGLMNDLLTGRKRVKL